MRNRRILTRREFLRYSMMAGGGLTASRLLAACAPAATEAPAPTDAPAQPTEPPAPEGLTGTVEAWSPDSRDDSIASEKWWHENFSAANPGVTVNQLTVSNAEMAAKIQAADEAGIPPDMFWTFGDLNFTYGLQGIAKSTDGLLEEIGLNRFPSTVLDGIRVDGQLYSIPFVGFPFFLYYRKDLYEEKGLQPPTTHEELLANVRAVHDPPNTYGYALTNKNLADTWNLKTAMFSHDAYFFDENDELALDRPETLEAWEFYKELGAYSQPGSMAENDVSTRQLMIDGKVAHMFTTTSFAANFEPEDIERQGGALYPLKPGARGVSLDFYGLIFPVKAKSPELAEALAKWIFEPENLEEFLIRTVVGWLPMVDDAYTPGYLDHPRIAPLKEYFEVGGESLKTGIIGTGYFGPSPNASVLVASDIEKQIGDRLVVLDESPRDVLDWAQAELEAAL